MIGLISCSAQKLDHAAPARELYTSPLFRRSLAYAEATCSVVYVLSALHDVVELDRVIESYNRRLGGKKERQAWGRRAAQRLVAEHGRDTAYMILAGSDYADPLSVALWTLDGHRGDGWRGVARGLIHTPLAGMSVGLRLRWLNEQLAGRTA